jgi:hypothetical protein
MYICFVVDFPNATDRADILRKTTRNGTRPRLHPAVSLDLFAAEPALDGFTYATAGQAA